MSLLAVISKYVTWIVIWIDGYIIGFDYQKDIWERRAQIDICLKDLDNSKDIKQEFLEEVKNQHKHGGNSAIEIYGITKSPKDGKYMMIMEYAKQGSLRKLLDSKYDELNWASKVANLYYIAKETELNKQVDKNFLTYDQVKYQTHPQAIYTSRSLNLSKLSKPVNAGNNIYFLKLDLIYSFSILIDEISD
ncbi:22389_t:CDS:2, partial [Cetraspora pellucida]